MQVSGLDWIDWLVVVVYLTAVAGVAWRAGRKHRAVQTAAASTNQKELEGDYALAGRSVPPWAAAVSFMATALSAATFIGLPNKGYASNPPRPPTLALLSRLVWSRLSLSPCIIANGLPPFMNCWACALAPEQPRPGLYRVVYLLRRSTVYRRRCDRLFNHASDSRSHLYYDHGHWGDGTLGAYHGVHRWHALVFG